MKNILIFLTILVLGAFAFSAEGDYTGQSFDTSERSDPYGITNDDTYFYISDSTTNLVHKYFLNGTDSGESFFVNTTFGAGLYTDGIYLWVTNNGQEDPIYLQKYFLNGTDSGELVEISGVRMTGASDLTSDGTYFWIVDTDDLIIYQFHLNGTYVGNSIDYGQISPGGTPKGITTDGTYLFVTDTDYAEVYKFHLNGTYTGFHFDTELSSNFVPFGITIHENYFYVTEESGGVYLYEYEAPTSEPTDSCSPPEQGNWIIDGDDNCVIKGLSVNLGENSIKYIGNGSITFKDSTIVASKFKRKTGDAGTGTDITLKRTSLTLLS